MASDISLITSVVSERGLMMIIEIVEAILGDRMDLQRRVVSPTVVKWSVCMGRVVNVISDLLIEVVELSLVEVGREVLVRMIVNVGVVD